MKKFIGLLVFSLGAFLLVSEIIFPRYAEAKDFASVKQEVLSEVVTEPVSATTEETTIPTTEETTEPEVDYFSGLLNVEHNALIGTLEGKNVNTTVSLGADDNDDIQRSVGIHESLSSPSRLVMFGHHMSNGTIFANLPQTEEGDKFTLTTTNGIFHFTVVSSEWVDVQTMEASNFEMLRNDHNMTLISCDWNDNVKGRRVVICDLDEK